MRMTEGALSALSINKLQNETLESCHKIFQSGIEGKKCYHPSEGNSL